MTETHGAEFIDEIIEQYASLYQEIEDGERREIDLRPRLVRRLFCNVLGWDHSEYAQEDDWNDVRFYDGDRLPAIILEGKRRDVGIDEGVSQVFRYASETAHADLLVSTNIDSFRLYQQCDPSHADAVTHHGVSARPVTEIDFKSVSGANSRVATHEDLSDEQRQSLQKLSALRREEVLNPERYEDFSFNNPADISEDNGFRELIRVLGLSLDEYFIPYASETFDQYWDRYEEYESRRDELETQIQRLEKSGHDETEIAELQTQLNELNDEYGEYAQFHSDFETWVRLSGRQDDDFADNKSVFCRESVYVQLNKLLLIRIAEDKGLTKRMISNGGVGEYFDFWDNYTEYVERSYVDLFELASEELSEIYEHLFARQIFDWEIRDDPDLDAVMQRTLWHLNHFDFSEVDRDILGHLYEEHLSPEERKQLGEFYTPTAIIDLILDSVGYTADAPLEREDHDLLDPACGSGGFIVRAARRLLKRLDRKGVPADEAIEIVRQRLHGFDINPFACHIAEINLLFQIIDKYQTAKAENPNYTLDGFNIYQTDSLRTENQLSLTALQSSEVRQYHEERREVDRLKQRDDYQFVVGNPPYVRIQNIPNGPARAEYDEYDVSIWNYDLSVLFFRKAGDWLREGGQVGFITSNKFIPSRYGREIRPYLAQNFQFNYLLDFGDHDVFETPQAYPMIFSGERINQEERSRSLDEFQPEDYVFTFAEANNTLPKISQTAVRAEDGDGTDSSDVEERDTTRTSSPRNIGEDPAEGRIADMISACLPNRPGEDPPGREDVEARLKQLVPDSTFEQPPLDTFSVPSSAIAEEDWRFVPAEEEAALKQIEMGGKPIQDYSNGKKLAKNGVQTGRNSIFLIDDNTIEEYGIEDELVKPLVAGENIFRWCSETPENPKLLYTTPDTELDDYTGAKEYLLDHKEDTSDQNGLASRYCVTKGIREWYELAEYRPDTFGQPLIFTPDVSYYSNFWYDNSGEVYGLNSVYVLYLIDQMDPYYQLGLLNSNVVQFFIRRIASSYGSDYLRYQWDYMKKVPLPDPADAPAELVAGITEAAEELSELRREYVDAKQLHADPAVLLDEFETKSLSYAGYIDRLGFQELDGELHPTRDGETIQFGVTGAHIEFTDERAAEIVFELLQAVDVTTADELRDLELPPLKPGLVALSDRYEEASTIVANAPETAETLEEEYNKLVYDLYGLDEATRELIRDRVARPENPLEPRKID